MGNGSGCSFDNRQSSIDNMRDMANTGLVQDARFGRHLTGPGHPERPQRLARIQEVLDERSLTEACRAIEVSPVDMKLVQTVHDTAYLERLRRACEDGSPFIDVPDSAICPESLEIAKLAAGGVVNAVDEVMSGRWNNAFCAEPGVEGAFRDPRHITVIIPTGSRNCG